MHGHCTQQLQVCTELQAHTFTSDFSPYSCSWLITFHLNGVLALYTMLVHGACGSMVCELLPTKLTTNFKRSLIFTAIFTV